MTVTPAAISVGLVGGGQMGALHARIVAQSPGAELAFISDPDQERGEALAALYDTKWIREVDGLDSCEALIIASPTETHFDLGTMALEGAKPVLIEKPLSEELDQARALIDVSRSLGVPMMCGFVERFNPAVITARKIIEDPVFIQTLRHSPYPNRIRVGVAHDLVVHDVDLALRFANSRPSTVSGTVAFLHPDSEAEDVIELRIRFPTSALASLSASRISQQKIRSLSVCSLDRLVEADLLRQSVTVYRHVLGESSSSEPGGYRQETIIDIPVVARGKEPLAEQFDHFLGLVDGTVDARSELDSLLAPHETIDAAMISAKSGSADQPIGG